MLRHHIKIIGAPLAQTGLRRQRKNPTHGVVVGAHDNTPSMRWRSNGANQPRARSASLPLCATSALPPATLGSARSTNRNHTEQSDCTAVRCLKIGNACTLATETSTSMQAIEHKPAKPPRIGKKIRQAVELMLSGQCGSQKAVCERLGISESYLSRSLKKDNIQAFITRATAKTIATGKLAATSTALRLVQGAKSEHVQLQASEFILGLNGMHANPSAPGVNINVGGGGAGYVIVLAKPDDEVLEGNLSEVGGVQFGRKMTDEERRTGVLSRSQPGALIDVTPNAAERPSSAPRSSAKDFER